MFFEELLANYQSGKIKKGESIFVVAPTISDYHVFAGKLADVKRDEKSHPTYKGHNPVILSEDTYVLEMKEDIISSFKGFGSGPKICNHKKFIHDHKYFTTQEDVMNFFEEKIKEDATIKEKLEKFFSEAKQIGK